MHSFGVHLSHIQKAHCLQHLQQQQEQQMFTINMTIVSTTLPHVVANTLKCSNFFVCSLPITSWISLIFTLARLKSSTEDKIFVNDFCNGILCSCSLSYSVKQQYMSTGANGNSPSCELFRTKVDKAYEVLCVELLYPEQDGSGRVRRC
jgi:hypothetical protein